MEEWMNTINSHLGNVRGFGSASDLSYKSSAQVTQFSKTGVPIREYTFNGIFPVNITEMDVDWNATDVLQDFNVTFQYNLRILVVLQETQAEIKDNGNLTVAFISFMGDTISPINIL